MCLTIFVSPLLDFVRMWNDNCDAATSKWITVNHCLGDQWWKAKNIFQFLWRDVFTLRKFKNVLRAVDNFDRAVRVNCHYIASLKPALRIKCLFGFVRSFIISWCNWWSFHAKFPSWVRFVCTKVLHLGYIDKSPLYTWNWTSNMTNHGIICPCESWTARSFS